MAAALVGAAFLTSFVNVLLDRLSSPELVNWIKGKKLDEKLCRRLKRTLTVVRVVLNDAEQKQITDPAVKEWLAGLEDAVYKADDLLDEITTKAVTQKDAGIVPCWVNAAKRRTQEFGPRFLTSPVLKLKASRFIDPTLCTNSESQWC